MEHFCKLKWEGSQQTCSKRRRSSAITTFPSSKLGRPEIRGKGAESPSTIPNASRNSISVFTHSTSQQALKQVPSGVAGAAQSQHGLTISRTVSRNSGLGPSLMSRKLRQGQSTQTRTPGSCKVYANAEADAMNPQTPKNCTCQSQSKYLPVWPPHAATSGDQEQPVAQQ